MCVCVRGFVCILTYVGVSLIYGWAKYNLIYLIVYCLQKIKYINNNEELYIELFIYLR